MINKIQVNSGRSSSATHRLTQSSTTLNRRYVHRPANLAIEEAARAASAPHPEEATTMRPSRLVNMKVHSVDLEAARAAEQAKMDLAAAEMAPVQPVTMYPHVIELGGMNTDNVIEESSMRQAVDSEAAEKSMSPSEPDSTVSAQPEIDTKDLAMNIAADYAAASLGASMKEYGNNYSNYAMSNPTTANPMATEAAQASSAPESVDAIAQAAAAAIASIRTATKPDEVSEQVASLKNFADNIKSNHSTPEMRELSDTIDKFVSIAMKSGKIQPIATKGATTKVALSPKANRAATKVARTSAKVMAKNRTGANVAMQSVRRPAVTKNNAVRRAPISRPVKRVSPEELKERAIEQALESVATMDEPQAQKHRQPAMRAKRKGGVKRFVIAFTCAAICVGGVIAFVSASIPDISVRVAAMQTGITAAYPSYVPRDYKLGDIFSEEGKITMVFNGPDNASFTLEEEKSSWDSSALLRNFVEANWADNYITTHEQGITIYIAESTSDAVWVNGGVLYKITSEGVPLTKKQVRSIVTSL